MPNPVTGTPIEDLTDGSPLVDADNLVIERGGTTNRKLAASDLKTYVTLSDAEIKTALENNVDTNTITDAEATVLGNTSGINTGDMSDADVKTAYENNADSNEFSDAEQTKLAGVATGATANTGDVVGPASAIDNSIPVYDSTTGKLIKAGSGGTLTSGALAVASVDTTEGMTSRESARYTTQTALGITGAVAWNMAEEPSAVMTSPTANVTLTISGGAVNAKAQLQFLQHASTARTLTIAGGDGYTAYWAEGDTPDLTQLLSGADGIWTIYVECVSATTMMLSYTKLSAVV